MSVYVIAVSVAMLAVCFIIRPTVQWLARNKEEHHAVVKEYYATAPKLIANEAVPEGLAKMLTRLSDDLDNPKAVHTILKRWLTGDMANKGREVLRAKFAEEMQSLTPELRDDFRATLAVGIIAMTYAAPFSGAVLRQLLFRPVGMPERSDDAPIFAYETGRDHCLAA